MIPCRPKEDIPGIGDLPQQQEARHSSAAFRGVRPAVLFPPEEDISGNGATNLCDEPPILGQKRDGDIVLGAMAKQLRGT
jgi:hypothetical protein